MDLGSKSHQCERLNAECNKAFTSISLHLVSRLQSKYFYLILRRLFVSATIIPGIMSSNDHKVYSYSLCWTGTSLQWRLMRGHLFKCKYFLIYTHALTPLQASSSLTLKIQIWSITCISGHEGKSHDSPNAEGMLEIKAKRSILSGQTCTTL